MSTKKSVSLGLFVLFSAFISLAPQTVAQEVRPRLAGQNQSAAPSKVSTTVQQRVNVAPNDRVTVSSAPRELVKSGVVSQPQQRRVLTNDVLVAPTVASRPVAAAANTNKAAGGAASGLAAFRARLSTAMNDKLGLPYRYGSEGPYSYDCSALVQTVFGNSGINFERTSARNYWNTFPPVAEADQYKFGTLVFFNRLGHVGIVIDENTFYHASSSKGVTYSKFEGYWGKRIVGFRRVPVEQIQSLLNQIEAAK